MTPNSNITVICSKLTRDIMTYLLAPGGNAKAILLNTIPQKSRGSIFGVYTIMDDLGKGLGPALVASWVRSLGRTDSFKFFRQQW